MPHDTLPAPVVDLRDQLRDTLRQLEAVQASPRPWALAEAHRAVAGAYRGLGAWPSAAANLQAARRWAQAGQARDLDIDIACTLVETLADAAEIRHTFAAGVVLDPYQYLVVFGAGTPDLPGIQALTGSTGSLSLNNSADSVSLFNAAGVLIDSVTYDDLAAQDQSIVRAPGGNGEFVLHTDVSPAIFSPGEGPVPQQPTAAVPEPVSAASMFLGLSLLRAARPKSRH